MSRLPTLRLRPPPSSGYLTNWAGISASIASGSQLNTKDPLIDIPARPSRTGATLNGSVSVNYPGGDNGSRVKAQWLRVELEKIEVVPRRVRADDESDDDDDDNKTSNSRFVELIGMRPEAVWEAKRRPVSTARPTAKKGRFGKGRKHNQATADEEDQVQNWEPIPDGNYSFSIAVPEGLPPSVDLDSAGNGVSYQLVATLCIKTKKGLLKTTTKFSTVTDSDTVYLTKADLLPSWPIFSPVMSPLIVPHDLPWVSRSPDEPTVGETKQSRVTIDMGHGEASDIVIKCYRDSSAYGPGDTVQLAVELMWPGYETLKLSLIRAEIVEQVVFRYPVDDRFGGLAQRDEPKSSICSSDLLNFSEMASSRAYLHPHQLRLFELQVKIPSHHSVATLVTAKFMEVTYKLRVEVMLENGKQASLQDWPFVLGPFGRDKADELVKEIGWIDKLCQRPGLERFKNRERDSTSPAHNAVGRRRSPDLSDLVNNNTDVRTNSGLDSSLRASADYSAIESFRTEADSTPTHGHSAFVDPRHRSDQLSHSSGTVQHRLNGSAPTSNDHSSSLSHSNHRLSGAAEEKRRLHEIASRTRDETQARYAADLAQTRTEKMRERSLTSSDESPDHKRQSYQLRDEPPLMNVSNQLPPARQAGRPTSESFATASPTDVGPATLHQAAVVPAGSPLSPSQPLDVLRSALAKAPTDRTAAEREAIDSLLSSQGNSLGRTSTSLTVTNDMRGLTSMTRSSTTVARSGSVAGSGTDTGSSPSTAVYKDSLAHAPIQEYLNNSDSNARLSADAATPERMQGQLSIEPPTSAIALVRSRTKASTAETEKQRLFRTAREEADRRQDEAQSVLDHQSRLLSHDEHASLGSESGAGPSSSVSRVNSGVVDLRIEDESELEKLRSRALQERDEIESRLREQERLEQDNWIRQERERQRRAREEFEDRMRENERRREMELRRLAEFQREIEEGNKQAMLQRRRQQDQIEMERLEDEKRRAQEHSKRLAEEAMLKERIQAQEEQRRNEEEEMHARERERVVAEERARAVEAHAQREREALKQQQERENWQERVGSSGHLQRSQLGANQSHFAVTNGDQSVGLSISGRFEPIREDDEREVLPPRLPYVSNLSRSGSIVSFAPSTSVQDADVSFYAKAIAESSSAPSSSSLQQDKAAYLRQLREREEARRQASNNSSSSRHGSSSRMSSFEPQTLLAPRPSPQKLERGSFDPLLSFGQDMPLASTPVDRSQPRFGPLFMDSSIHNHSQDQSYGRNEAAMHPRHNRPEKSRQSSGLTSPLTVNAPSAPPGDFAGSPLSDPMTSYQTITDDSLPSYPVGVGPSSSNTPQQAQTRSSAVHDSMRDFAPPIPGSSNGVVHHDRFGTGGSTTSESSAAQEKMALTAYYAAKAAVDAHATSSSSKETLSSLQQQTFLAGPDLSVTSSSSDSMQVVPSSLDNSNSQHAVNDVDSIRVPSTQQDAQSNTLPSPLSLS
ncbi:hypothetical protein OIO90_003904 [Microbotryomycetes sp. JL221]|nr:hypothetical protein OIO90_003904 [Microbotryomycetes sp. JL221]